MISTRRPGRVTLRRMGSGMGIGAASRASGVGVALLRAWEDRYGVPTPARTAGGTRRYTAADLAQVRRMSRLIDAGLAPSAAARALLGEPPPGAAGTPDDIVQELERTVMAFDEAGMHACLDRGLAAFSLATVVGDVVCPLLRRVGDGWHRRRVSVPHEHFASHVLRGRLLALGRGWGEGRGPLCVLAAVGGEHHDLGLVMLGLGLRNQGWRVVFLGADTPAGDIEAAARQNAADAVVVSATIPGPREAAADELARVGSRVPLFFAGPASDAGAARNAGAMPLDGGPMEAARALRVRAAGAPA